MLIFESFKTFLEITEKIDREQTHFQFNNNLLFLMRSKHYGSRRF